MQEAEGAAVVGLSEAPRGMARVWAEAPTPSYVVDEARLTENLLCLARVRREAGCRILLAQKAFSMFYFYPLIRRYLDGSTASGLYEARLGREAMGGEVHVFSPAYREEELDELLSYADHIVFNSFGEWRRYGARARAAGASCGLRVNPEHSTQETPLYDPCAPGSRLGVRLADFEPDALDGLDGLHFHTLCEQGAEPLAETLAAFEARFGAVLSRMRWVNFGGGHHITKPGYDTALLAALVRRMRERYGLTVYLEPGEAVAYHAGDLVSSVLDVVATDGLPVAILDASAACHMPDVLEMPYRPPLYGAGAAGEKARTYRLAGPTCLAGDVIGDYSFDAPLARGTRVVFGDMAIYSMVKNNTFNGMALPAIVAAEAGGWRVVRRFGYEDFRARLS